MNETTAILTPTTTDHEHRRSDASGARRRRLGRVATIAMATVLPLLVWTIAVPLGGMELVAGSGPTAQTVAPASVVFAGLVTGFAAWGVLALLERFATRSAPAFAIIGWTVLALSLLGPVVTGATGAVLVVLLAMHLVAGTTLMIGLPLAAGRSRRSSMTARSSTAARPAR
jgi:hypothetical protein